MSFRKYLFFSKRKIIYNKKKLGFREGILDFELKIIPSEFIKGEKAGFQENIEKGFANGIIESLILFFSSQ